MKTKVADYKGFEIYFDSDSELFSVEGYDHYEDKKKSFNSCKTYIRNFIKENSVFGSFDIVKIPTERTFKGPIHAKVVGIHANGNFMCETPEGDKFQLSTSYEYDMKKWCLPEDLEKSEYNQEKVNELKEQISDIRKQISEEEKKLPKPCIEVFKKVQEEYKELWN